MTMRSRGISGAYRELDAALRKRGYAIPSSRVERWCYWRDDGLVDRPERQGAGRGSRSRFVDLGRATEQVIAVDEALRPRDSLDLVALRLAAGGSDLAPADIKAAYLSVIQARKAKFLRDARAHETDDPIERAANVGWATHRAFTRGRRAHARIEAGLESHPGGWIQGGRILLGERLTHSEAVALANVSGMNLIAACFGQTRDDVVSWITTFLPLLSFDGLEETGSISRGETIVAALRFAHTLRGVLTPALPALAGMYDEDGIHLAITAFMLALPVKIPEGDKVASLLVA